MGTPRLLLLEWLSTERFAQYRGERFPFFQGWAARAAVPTKWVAFGIDPRAQSSNRYVIDLPPADRVALSAVLKDFRPTHAVSSEVLEEGLRAALVDEVPGLALEVCESRPGATWEDVGTLRSFLGGVDGDAARDRDALVDAVVPDATSVPGNDLATRIRPFLRILAGAPCVYARSARDNPLYAGVDLSGCEGPSGTVAGCAFCGTAWPGRHAYATPAVELAIRQVHALAATCPDWRWSGEFLIDGARVFPRLDRFVDGVLAKALRPSCFLFKARADDLVRMARRIDAVLPRVASAGHALGLSDIGVDNFSPAENQRFNKGLTARQVGAALGHLRRWEAQWPDAFRFSRYGGLSFITFTPWTTLDDLRINIRTARRLGLDFNSMFLTKRLILLPGRPITRLAARDGLLAPAFPADGTLPEPVCLLSASDEELPWRFAHPEVGVVHAVLTGLYTRSSVIGSGPRPDSAALAQLPEPCRDPKVLFPALVEAAAAEPGMRDPDALLAKAVLRIHARRPRKPRAIPAPPGRGADGTGMTSAASAAAPAAVADPPPSPAARVARRLARLLERVAGLPGDPLAGYRPGEVGVLQAGPGWGGVVVVLSRSDACLAIELRPATDPSPSFLKTGRVAASWRADGPADTPEKARVLGIVAALCDRAVAGEPG